jgi:small-conductance mechanosensitive channel
MSQDTGQATTPSTTEKVSVGNPKDIQGILALAIIIGYVAIAAAVIFTHLVTDPTAILTGLSTLAAAVSAFYFGVKSQQ